MMSERCALAFCLAVAVCVMAPTQAVADWYDDFSDGLFWENDPTPPNNVFWVHIDPVPPFDPNLWDMDDPHWSLFTPMAGVGSMVQIVNAQAGGNLMRLYGTPDPLTGLYAFLAAYVDDQDLDPNTSTTYFDDATSHYVLARMIYPGHIWGPDDPNRDCGKANIMIHGNLAVWAGLVFEIDFDDKIPPWVKFPNDPNYLDADAYQDTFEHGWGWYGHQWGTHHANLQTGAGTDWRNLRRIWIDPNGVRDVNSSDPNTSDPNDTLWLPHLEGNNKRDPNHDDPSWYGVDINTWEREGFWLLAQFELDPNHPNKPGDPNGKFFKGAIWQGDKYDWDGTWLLEGELSSTYWSGGTDPLEWYTLVPGGFSGVAAWADLEYTSGFPSDIGAGDFEGRIGLFTNVSRTLTVKMKDCSSLNLEPNLAHPDGGEKRRYTQGTPIVLDTVVPVGNKVFKKWTIKGPNDSGDPLYQIVSDTNEVVYLTMDGDYLVKATCKCGGGGIEPFAGMVLLVLGLGVIVRRLT